MNYFHRGIPRANGHCPSCDDKVTTAIANQGQRVDISDYRDCTELTPRQRLQINLDHAQDRVRRIEREIQHLELQSNN